MSGLGESFFAQNEAFARGLTEYEQAVVRDYADHHAGGLIVLFRYLDEPDLCVKAHDSWGDVDSIVVHVYDPEDPDRDWMAFFDSGSEALAAFLNVTFDDLEGWDS